MRAGGAQQPGKSGQTPAAENVRFLAQKSAICGEYDAIMVVGIVRCLN